MMSMNQSKKNKIRHKTQTKKVVAKAISKRMKINQRNWVKNHKTLVK